jgi:hypothetical protein
MLSQRAGDNGQAALTPCDKTREHNFKQSMLAAKSNSLDCGPFPGFQGSRVQNDENCTRIAGTHMEHSLAGPHCCAHPECKLKRFDFVYFHFVFSLKAGY